MGLFERIEGALAIAMYYRQQVENYDRANRSWPMDPPSHVNSTANPGALLEAAA
jgi:hypothetical protein